MNKKPLIENYVVGIIPSAGMGTRLGYLPFSKELFPIGKKEFQGKIVPKLACDHLIDHMTNAGIKEIHFVLRKGKWDIPNYYGGGLNHRFQACYHVADYSYGVPFSVNQVFPFIKNKIVVLGFPDILFKPKNAYNLLLEAFKENDNTDVVLGVMPVLRPEKWDMVELDSEQNVKRLIIKSNDGKKMPYGWTIAAWKQQFSEFLNHKISTLILEKSKTELENIEIYFGHIIIEAIKAGFKVRGVIFDNGSCLDIGTPEDLAISTSFLEEDIDLKI